MKFRCWESFVGIQKRCNPSDSLLRMLTEVEVIPFIWFVRQRLSTFTQTGLANFFLFPTSNRHHLVVLYGDRLDNTSIPHDPIAAWGSHGTPVTVRKTFCWYRRKKEMSEAKYTLVRRVLTVWNFAFVLVFCKPYRWKDSLFRNNSTQIYLIGWSSNVREIVSIRVKQELNSFILVGLSMYT